MYIYIFYVYAHIYSYVVHTHIYLIFVLEGETGNILVHKEKRVCMKRTFKNNNSLNSASTFIPKLKILDFYTIN